ncbi:MAG: VanZ family protein [Clostridia bacterium]|nr:VanZ family protein [Clostridia bacterium]
MLNYQTKKFNNALIFIAFSICTVLSVIPSFTLTGHFFIQNIATVIIVFAIFLSANLLKVKPQTIAAAVCVSISFWIGFAVVKQIVNHFIFNDTSFTWRYMFFYDKIMTLYMLWISIAFFYTVKIFTYQNDELYIADYKSFIKIMSKIFVILYIITFLYCFILCRTPVEEALPVNLTPFNAFTSTFLSKTINYEALIYFFGNIVIFLPLGTIISRVTKNIPVLIFTPIIFSCSIEVLQYFTHMGYADIDDVILNTLGFYLGILLNFVFNKISEKFNF